MSEKAFTIIIAVGMVLVGIIYALYIFFSFKSGTGIFTPYVPPAPPTHMQPFYPLGTVTPMTADEIAKRNEIIKLSANSNF